LPERRSRLRDRSDEPQVSVIVPTRDRPGSLDRCLEALARQSYEPLEIVVIDDGSAADDEVAAIVGRHGARLVRGAGRGPAAARNAGVRDATGVLLCFTDDDCEPGPEWAERLVRRLQSGADAVAGKTLSAGGAIANASELAAHAPAGVAPPPGSDIAFAPSNNLACTRAAFEATAFDESYPDAAGEDREWCARLTAAGHVLAFEPGALVIHRQRLTLRSFLGQQARYGRGAFRFRARAGRRGPLESAAFYAALLREGFRQGPRVGLLLAVAQGATAIGYGNGWWEASTASRIKRRRRATSGADGA
jgi:glycosyltransferase involved in cell wall biosynthesis